MVARHLHSMRQRISDEFRDGFGATVEAMVLPAIHPLHRDSVRVGVPPHWGVALLPALPLPRNPLEAHLRRSIME
jgi:hypothetical protein